MEAAETPRSLTLEETAAIIAALDLGTPRDAVLAEARLSPDAWEAARDGWLAKIAAEASRGRLRLHRRYLALVEASRDRLADEARRGRKKLAGPAPGPPAAVLVHVASTPAHDVAERAPAAAHLAPPPARPETLPPISRSSPNRSTGPLALAAQSALPFQPGAPGAHRAPEMHVPVLEMDDDEPRPTTRPGSIPEPSSELPFNRPSQPQISPPATAPPGSRRPPSQLTMTGPLQWTAPRAADLPFARQPAAPGPPGKTLIDGDDEPPTRRSSVRGAALPFAPPPARRSEPGAASVADPEAMRRAQSMTLGEYASVCAQVRAAPDNAQAVRASLGLDVRAWTALHMLWQERFQREPALRARWESLVEQALEQQRA